MINNPVVVKSGGGGTTETVVLTNNFYSIRYVGERDGLLYSGQSAKGTTVNVIKGSLISFSAATSDNPKFTPYSNVDDLGVFEDYWHLKILGDVTVTIANN